MYLDHFGLAVNPFSLSPKLEFLFKSGAFEESMAHLVYGVENREAITMITGPIGTGKTMALQSFMANLQRGFQWALVTNTQVTATELLKLVLDDLGVEFPPSSDKSDLLILFKKFIIEAVGRGQRVVVIVDEAQNMGREVLEEVRLLTNLSLGDVQPIQVILVGQPELEDVVNQKELAQLRQRIRVHYRLEPLSRQELEAYLNHRMSVAGCKDQIFKPGAVDRIARFSGGVPRLANSLAGHALLAAYVARRKIVTAEDVEEPEGVARPQPGLPAPRRPEPAVPSPEPRTQTSGSRDGASAPERARVAAPARSDRETRAGGRGFRRILVLVVLLAVCAAAVFFIREELKGLLRLTPERRATATTAVGAVILTAPRDAAAVVVPAGTGDQDVTATADSIPAHAAAGGNLAAIPEAPVAAGHAGGDSAPVPGAPAAEPVLLATAAIPPPAEIYAHVASFKDSQRAERWSERLQREGSSTSIRTHEVAGVLWHRVYIGPYPDNESAREAVTRIPDYDENHYYQICVIDPYAIF